MLSDEESEWIRARLRDRWGPDAAARWYPLVAERPADVEAFQAPWFWHETHRSLLPAILRRREVSRIWEIREGGLAARLDSELFEPVYNGEEGFWTSDALDWIAYASHESSLTIGGWLLDEVRAAWPGWASRVYTGWDFAWPPVQRR